MVTKDEIDAIRMGFSKERLVRDLRLLDDQNAKLIKELISLEEFVQNSLASVLNAIKSKETNGSCSYSDFLVK